MEKRQELYRGKAKTVYATDDPRYLVMHYRDDVSAFDGVKLAKLEQKGETNNRINALRDGEARGRGRCDALRAPAQRARIAGQGDEDDPGRMRRAERRRGVDGEALRHRGRHAASRADLRVLPEERCAARPAVQRRPHPRARLGERRRDRADEGADPQGQRPAEAAVRARPASTSSTTSSSSVTRSTIRAGRSMLGDEFTPDGCRLWDAKTGEKMDKDRFRRDLGEVIAHYREVGRRIGVPFRDRHSIPASRVRPRFRPHRELRISERADPSLFDKHREHRAVRTGRKRNRGLTPASA